MTKQEKIKWQRTVEAALLAAGAKRQARVNEFELPTKAGDCLIIVDSWERFTGGTPILFAEYDSAEQLAALRGVTARNYWDQPDVNCKSNWHCGAKESAAKCTRDVLSHLKTLQMAVYA